MNASNARTVKILGMNDSHYPDLLKQISNPPDKIFLRGESQALTGKNIAIVGTRKATAIGLKLAEEMAYKLSQLGLGIVSGLAMGIDAAAHRGALKANGETIAVLGCGIDCIYPSSNERLGHEIIESGGAIITEHPASTPGYKGNFLERNRITSGISIATVIIEAPFRSGAINTASWAGDQGRTVFVLPGPTTSRNYEGSHKLIRDGATLISRVEDIIEDLDFELRDLKPKKVNQTLDELEISVFDALEKAGEPVKIDRIIELTSLSAQKTLSALAKLTIKNLIAETPSGYAPLNTKLI